MFGDTPRKRVWEEGARGRCYWCGRARGEHDKALLCPKDGVKEWDESRAGDRTKPKLWGEGSAPLDYPSGRAGRR